MENHHCLWENSLFLWSFSIAMKLPEGTMCPLLFQASCTQFEVPTASWRCLFGENFESLTLKLMDIILYIYIIYTDIYPSIFLEILISIPIISHLDLSYTSFGIYILGQSSIPSHLSLWVNPSIYIYISHLVHKGIYR